MPRVSAIEKPLEVLQVTWAQGAVNPSEGHTGSWMLIFRSSEGKMSSLVPFHPHCAQWHNFLCLGQAHTTLRFTLPLLRAA